MNSNSLPLKVALCNGNKDTVGIRTKWLKDPSNNDCILLNTYLKHSNLFLRCKWCNTCLHRNLVLKDPISINQSINQSINDVRVYHATQALGHNVVQSST